ncbi:unnamed protein product [Symbiodinium sp. CCMP2592]|nr:unnamed protein product [Symbiodinium sp. CCMP2592]
MIVRIALSLLQETLPAQGWVRLGYFVMCCGAALHGLFNQEYSSPYSDEEASAQQQQQFRLEAARSTTDAHNRVLEIKATPTLRNLGVGFFVFQPHCEQDVLVAAPLGRLC